MEHSSPFQHAIDVRNVFYSMNREEVLLGVNMKVRSGSMYGLLGPSGCGKTTLLRCIVGSYIPEHGQVKVFGKNPGQADVKIPGKNVGYMPQEAALYDDLTIDENLRYFGKITLMNPKLIKARIDETIKVLDLPEKTRWVGSLSGGQKRRTSFAASMLHFPPLLILDEPTAGVDPLLREKIWCHLLHMSATHNTTIIITTQYIDEARKAHKIGFMRRGIILDEDAPETFIMRSKRETLEDVFLDLCLLKEASEPKTIIDPVEYKQTDPKIFNWALNKVNPKADFELPHLNDMVIRRLSQDLPDESITLTKMKSNEFTLINPLARLSRTLSGHNKNGWKQTLQAWYTIFLALLWKNFLKDLRDPLVLLFQYVLPFTSLIFFAICIGGTPIHINIGVVNEEQPPYLSQMFLNNLSSKHIVLKDYGTFEEAMMAARRLDVWAFFHIQANYSDYLLDRLDYYSSDLTNDAIEKGTLRIYSDQTHKIVELTTLRYLDGYFQEFLVNALEEVGMNPAMGRLPIQISAPIYGEYEKNDYTGFRNFMIPGMIINFTFANAFALTLFTLVLERSGQTFERNHVAGVSSFQTILAHVITRVCLMIPYFIIIINLPIYVFGVPAHGPIVVAVLLLLCVNFTGLSFGILMSCFCTELLMAMILTAGVLFFSLFTSGAIWPLESTPLWTRWLSNYQPTTYPLNALRNILFKGRGIENYGVYMGFTISLGWALLFFLMGAKFFRFNK